ncbi:ABC transporter substrate-binding protein [Saccharopolyspora sp. 5N708]|uniref:ABC transporter substrate-binding protein n=1 Tax=Saccharopolyspora sp. 5N708 TaxID=3457424 RepID=UPI003FD4B1AC
MDSDDLPMLNRRRMLAGIGGLVASGMLLPGLTSCGSSAAPTVPAAAVPPDVVEAAKGLQNKSASVLSMQMYTKQADNAVKDAYDVFAEQTGTKISNASFSADAGNFIAKQDAAVRAGQVQDLAFISGQRFVPQMQQLGMIQDVSDVVADMAAKYGPPAPVAENYLKIGGKWWGVPFYSIGSGYFLRKDWLAEKGINVSDVATYENARDIALEISDPAKNRFGWGFSVNRGGDANGLIIDVMNAYGSSICSDDGTKVIFNTPQTVEAITFLADIYVNPKYQPMLPPGVMSWTDTANNEAWLAGLIGITLNQASLYAQSKTTKNPVYDGTAVIDGLKGPAISAALPFGDLTAFVIFKGAKNPELAKLVPKYLAAGQTMRSLVEASGAGVVLPAYDGVWKSDPYFLGGDPIYQVTYNAMSAPIPAVSTTGLHFPQAPSAGENAVRQAYVLTDMMGEIVQGKSNVASAVATAHDRMVQVFEQQGLQQ